MQRKRNPEGVRARHSRSCPAAGCGDGRCRCQPSYEAFVFSKRDGKKIRKTFPTLAAARSWRADATVAVKRGAMRAAERVTLREAAEAWLEGAKAGTIRTRSGDPYKPSALRSYEAALRQRLLPDLGGARLADIARVDVQDFADRLLAEGLDPSTIRNCVMPLRAIFRHAIRRNQVIVNPTRDLELPAVRGRRDRTASVEEMDALLGVVPARDRAIWATAMLAGLRLGELRALRLGDLDLNSEPCPLIRVERAWDPKAGIIAPKSRAGARVVPVPSDLRRRLIEHRLALGWNEGFVFGRTATVPFNPSTLYDRAWAAWNSAELQRIGLHECRHSYRSLCGRARVSKDSVRAYLGHADEDVTDRYYHGSEEQMADDLRLIDNYLEAARARPNSFVLSGQRSS